MLEATRKRLQELGFEKLPREVLADVREAIQFRLVRADEKDIRVGQSKFGGAPDIPPDTDWPVDPHGKPMAFFCQLNFAEIAQFDLERKLPAKGWLYFFISSDVTEFEEDEPGLWRVMFAECDQATQHREKPPASLATESGDDTNVCIEPCRVMFEREIQFGGDFEDWYNELVGGSVEDDNPEAEAAAELLEKMDEWTVLRDGERVSVCVDTSRPGDEPKHQLLGHPQFSGYEEPKGHRLLLKIDADVDATGMGFVDAGTWFVYIAESALAKRDFSRTVVRLAIG